MYKAGFGNIVVIEDAHRFFEEYVCMDVFLKHRNAIHDAKISERARSFTRSLQSSLHSGSSSLDSTAPTEASQTLVPVANPSSTSLIIINPNDDFQPSRKRLELRRSITPERLQQALQANVDLGDNYEGDVTSFALKCATTPAHESCAVRFERLPVETTLQEFFENTWEGKVFQLSWTEPEPPLHPGRSGRLVFSTRRAAEEYIERGGYYSGRRG